MTEIMLAAASSSTSVYFGFNFMCCKHNEHFTMEHVEHYNKITGFANIRKFAQKPKEQNIRNWNMEERR